MLKSMKRFSFCSWWGVDLVIFSLKLRRRLLKRIVQRTENSSMRMLMPSMPLRKSSSRNERQIDLLSTAAAKVADLKRAQGWALHRRILTASLPLNIRPPRRAIVRCAAAESTFDQQSAEDEAQQNITTTLRSRTNLWVATAMNAWFSIAYLPCRNFCDWIKTWLKLCLQLRRRLRTKSLLRKKRKPMPTPSMLLWDSLGALSGVWRKSQIREHASPRQQSRLSRGRSSRFWGQCIAWNARDEDQKTLLIWKRLSVACMKKKWRGKVSVAVACQFVHQELFCSVWGVR